MLLQLLSNFIVLLFNNTDDLFGRIGILNLIIVPFGYLLLVFVFCLFLPGFAFLDAALQLCRDFLSRFTLLKIELRLFRLFIRLPCFFSCL